MTQPLVLEPLGALPTPARLGETLGKYRLDRILATGGMGVVVAARHLQLDQPIAIKFMSPLLVENEMGVARFLREARAAAHIRSEHVVRVLDVETLPSGTPYIVMEYLEGEDLSRMLERRGRVSVSEAVDYVLQACEALAEAHVAGIVHRDLKPGNLFCCTRPDGAPLIKVLDFGVSKLLPRADPELRANASTGPHVIMGTPLYSSPEQLRSSANVDARADIWALGVILYELVAGRPPFAADTFMQICAKVAYVPCRPLQDLRPDVPPQLAAVVARCLAKEPSDRFQTIAEFAKALAPLAPRGSLLSIERTEKIIIADAKAHALDQTLPSAPISPKPSMSPSSVTPRHGVGPRSHLWRVVVWSVAGGAVAGAIVAASLAAAMHRAPAPAVSAGSWPSQTVSVVSSAARPSPPVPAAGLPSDGAAEPAEARPSADGPIELAPPPEPTPPSPPAPARGRQARETSPSPSTAGFGGLL
jgi:serine/threonine protein kinase